MVVWLDAASRWSFRTWCRNPNHAIAISAAIDRMAVSTTTSVIFSTSPSTPASAARTNRKSKTTMALWYGRPDETPDPRGERSRVLHGEIVDALHPGDPGGGPGRPEPCDAVSLGGVERGRALGPVREDRERRDRQPAVEVEHVLVPDRVQDPEVVRARQARMDPAFPVDPHQREHDLLDRRRHGDGKVPDDVAPEALHAHAGDHGRRERALRLLPRGEVVAQREDPTVDQDRSAHRPRPFRAAVQRHHRS